MRFRTTLVLLVVLAALGSYVFLVETKKPAPEDSTATLLPTSLPQLFETTLALQVDHLLVQMPASGQQTELARDKQGTWWLVAPTSEEADADRVDRVVQSLLSARPSRSLPPDAKPEDYGLQPPQIKVTMVCDNGDELVLLLGEANPGNTGIYGLGGNGQSVVLLPYYLKSDAEGLILTLPVKPTPTPELSTTVPPRIPEAPTEAP